LLERLFVEERRRLKIIPNAFGEKAVLKLMYDLLDFEMNLDSGFEPPSSYAGMSGGAVWRFFVDVNEDQPKVLERWLFGVPFYESPTLAWCQEFLRHIRMLAAARSSRPPAISR
jgi:hypothetical protein